MTPQPAQRARGALQAAEEALRDYPAIVAMHEEQTERAEAERDRYHAALEDAAEYLRLASTWIVDTDRHDKMLAAHRRAKEALQRA